MNPLALGAAALCIVQAACSASVPGSTQSGAGLDRALGQAVPLGRLVVDLTDHEFGSDETHVGRVAVTDQPAAWSGGFIFVEAGQDEISAEGGGTTVRAGEAIYVPAGSRIAHRATPDAQVYRFGLRPSTSPGPLDLYASGALAEADLPRPGERATALLLQLPTRGATARHQHAGIEVVFVLAGEVALMVDGQQTVQLPARSGHTIPRTRAHLVRNVGGTPARLLLLLITPAQ